MLVAAVAALAVITSSCEEEEPRRFQAGTNREDAYKILGLPENVDSQVVVVWCWPKKFATATRGWRDLLAQHEVAYIAVFDENGRSITPLVDTSNLDVDPRFSDEYARETARSEYGERK